MKQWPKNSKKLIQYFGRLPGVGPKMAERIVLYLQRQSHDLLNDLGDTLKHLSQSVIRCNTCYTFSEQSICEICQDLSRQKDILLVVADPVTAYTIEQSGEYRGLFFILGGYLNPLDGTTPDKLRFKALINRFQTKPPIKEVIVGFNATVEGEATQLYIKKLLSHYPNIHMSKLARGLPMGSDISYADAMTLREAISYRQRIT